MSFPLRDLQLLYGQAVYEADVWKRRAEALGRNLEEAAKGSVEHSGVAAFRVEVNGPKETSAARPDDEVSETEEPANHKKPLSSYASGQARHRLYVGLGARVAKRLGVSQSVVCRVLKGNKVSKRIAAAVAQEVRRIEKEVEQLNGRAG